MMFYKEKSMAPTQPENSFSINRDTDWYLVMRKRLENPAEPLNLFVWWQEQISHFPQPFAKNQKQFTMLQGDDIRWKDGQCLTIMRIQSVLGAADVWRMAMLWQAEVSGGTESRTGFCPRELPSFPRGT